jgi:phosphatidylserine/phosphatidylglycerophosphate/cardiolipin synthase-like enzyme
LVNLCESDLRTLASAIRTGRLVAPFSIFALQRLIGDAVSPSVADWMTATAESGCSSAAMASWLDACADGICERTPLEHTVQLVTTAPEGNAAYHRDTAVVVQDLFRRAKRSVLISTYALYGGREIFQTLADRMEAIPELLVRMFVNIDQKSGDDQRVIAASFVQQFREWHWPAQFRLPEIYYDVRSTAVLHAKCILIDSEELFVTSANFTDAAQHRNVEVGLVVKSPVVADQATRFFESLMKSQFYARAL